MQVNKKISTTLIITILTISMIAAAIPMALAEITTPPLVVAKGGTAAVSGGPVGTQVDVVGNATSGAASPFSTVKVYWDDLGGAVLGQGNADVNGAYRITVTIPAAKAGTHYLVVNDGETESTGTAFVVSPKISVDVKRALPGDVVTVTGAGYNASKTVTLTLNSTTLGTPNNVAITVAPTTDVNGSFTVSFTIPAMNTSVYDVYNLHGTDSTANTASTTITIDYYITCTPATGPTGITTTIAGRIQASTPFSITFNGAPIPSGSGTTTSDGSYSVAYTIPGVLSPASYQVQIVWATTKNRNATFTVTSPPTISLDSSSGVAGKIVTLSGSGFSGKADITLYFAATAVNSTTMNAGFGPTTTPGGIPAGVTFVVPTLTPGVYAVSVVDEYGATSASGVFFTIDPTPVTSIALRGTSYYPLDILSFDIMTTDPFSGPNQCTVTIRDPSGLTTWTGVWTLTAVGPTWRMLYQNQMIQSNYLMLAADAPLGQWNWTIAYTGTSAGAKVATGLFSVVAKPDMQTVIDKIDECCDTIESVMTTSEGKIIAAINTKTGTIMTDIAALEPQLQAITDTVVIIATMLGEVQVDIASLDLAALDALGVDIAAIKGDVATIKTNIGTVDVAVDSLDAVLGAVAGQLVEVQTTLGTLDGKIESIEGNTATVITDVGALQVDVTDVSGKVDMTPIWIAVVLSLVAAIAAIFAVITIRQKIAG